jgi:hypothetical protein
MAYDADLKWYSKSLFAIHTCLYIYRHTYIHTYKCFVQNRQVSHLQIAFWRIQSGNLTTDLDCHRFSGPLQLRHLVYVSSTDPARQTEVSLCVQALEFIHVGTRLFYAESADRKCPMSNKVSLCMCMRSSVYVQNVLGLCRPYGHVKAKSVCMRACVQVRTYTNSPDLRRRGQPI